MPYTTYFDLKLRPDPDTPAWDRMGRVWRAVHVASGRLHIPFAVAFPEWMNVGFTLGERIRIWTESQDNAERLCDDLDTFKDLPDIVECLRIRKKTDPKFYEAYFMRRISSGVSRKLAGDEKARSHQMAARQRRIVQQAGLPFVRMRSSSGNLFRLVIERVSIGPVEGNHGMPNGYGLSRASQVVTVPVVE